MLMTQRERGLFIVVDGLDAIGKGEIEHALIEYEQAEGRKVYNTIEHSIAKERVPRPEECIIEEHPADTLVTAEPTWAGIGRVIREEMISSQGQSYSLAARIGAYALDRLVQMKRLIIPFLNASIDHRIIQSRCLASTLCYQVLEAKNEGRDIYSVRENILNEEGNQLQLSNPPDLLIIPTIHSIKEIMNRIESRRTNKDDNCIFENYKFQEALRPFYEDPWLRNLFEELGTKVEYIKAGVSIKDTKRQAVAIYKNFIKPRV